MGCKIRWDIPTNHPKNCRCTPCLSVNVFDKKPPMTAMIREALPSHEWEKIIFQTSANVVNRQAKTMAKAFREFGETVHKTAEAVQKNVQVNQKPLMTPAAMAGRRQDRANRQRTARVR